MEQQGGNEVKKIAKSAPRSRSAKRSMMKLRQLKTKRLLASGVSMPTLHKQSQSAPYASDIRLSSPTNSEKDPQPEQFKKDLVAGVVCTKVNSFNKKTRLVFCDEDLQNIIWKSTKVRKQHYNLGSVPTSEFRSILVEGNRMKLSMDSRTLEFVFNDKSELANWTILFRWLLSHVEKKRRDAKAQPLQYAGKDRVSKSGLSNRSRRKRASTTGVIPTLSTSPPRPLSLRSEQLVRSSSDNYSKGKHDLDHMAKSQTVVGIHLPKETEKEMETAYKEDKIKMYELVAMLFEGQLFYRYKPGQKTKTRFVWFSFLLDNVLYSLDKLHRHSTRPRGNLASVDITAIVAGGESVIRTECLPGQEMFSIVSKDTTLHLSTDSAALRDRWVKALHFVLWLVSSQDGRVEDFYFWYSSRGEVKAVIPTVDSNGEDSTEAVGGDNNAEEEVKENIDDSKEDKDAKRDTSCDNKESVINVPESESKEAPTSRDVKTSIPRPFFASAPPPLIQKKRRTFMRSNSVDLSVIHKENPTISDLTSSKFLAYLKDKGEAVAIGHVELLCSLHEAERKVADLATLSGQSQDGISSKTVPWNSLVTQSKASLMEQYKEYSISAGIV